MSGAQIAILVAFGVVVFAALGSFMCVIIDRLPLGLDEPNQYGEVWETRPWGEVLGGSSRCSSCGEPVRPFDNVPVLSWLVLRGRCRGCGDRIPAFHPIVELLVPLIAALIVWGNGWTWTLLPYLFLVPVGVAIAVIDLRTLIVPTRLVWPSTAVVVALSVVAALLEGEPASLFGGLVGIAVLAGPLFLLWWFNPKGMGFGDVRLTVLLGWIVGFAAAVEGTPLSGSALLALLVMVGASVLGILHWLVMLGRNRQIPFGPPLVFATFAALALAQQFAEPLL